MKILIAPDSFKDSLSANEVCQIIKRAFSEVFKDASFDLIPLADGGEGSLDSLKFATKAKEIWVEVRSPFNETIKANYLLKDELAFIEMAKASGLELVEIQKRQAKLTTSFGIGELIKDALENGAKEIIVGIGGSATNDAGAGLLQALGAKLLDKNNKEIDFGGVNLDKLCRVDFSSIDKRVFETKIKVACDVDNPLTGENGASFVYGWQKGATKEDIEVLDKNLSHFARIVKRDLDKDIANIKGAGAAGGVGAALLLLDANLVSGFELMSSILNLPKKIELADLIITGEGRFDSQSMNGKVVCGIYNLTQKYSKPLIVIAGALKDEADGDFAAFSTVLSCLDIYEALKQAKINLYNASKNIAKSIKIGMNL